MSEPVPVDIRLNEDGTLDEIVSPFIHLEQMGPTHWWLAAYDARGERVTVSFHSKAKIKAVAEREGATGHTSRTGDRQATAISQPKTAAK